MQYERITIPDGGEPITVNPDSTIRVPDAPITETR